jgi:sugar/nucleoside kinase (ribokinase family)
VALTAGDAGLAVRKREELWGALHTGVDLLFTNRCTGAVLTLCSHSWSAPCKTSVRDAPQVSPNQMCAQTQALLAPCVLMSHECVCSRVRSEASALVGSECSAQQAALALGPHADMVVVTDGADGSCISALGSLQVWPCCCCQHEELCNAPALHIC